MPPTIQGLHGTLAGRECGIIDVAYPSGSYILDCERYMYSCLRKNTQARVRKSLSVTHVGATALQLRWLVNAFPNPRADEVLETI